MHRIIPPMAVLAFSFCFAACSRDDSAPQPGPAQEPKSETDANTVPRPTGTISVDPATFSMCEFPAGLITASVEWDAIDPGIRTIQIWVESPTIPRKLWTTRNAKGKGDTGPWVRDKTTFTLADAATSETLATATVTAIRCDAATDPRPSSTGQSTD